MEGQVEQKPWYKSRAKLACIVFGAIVALEQGSAAMGHPIIVPMWVKEALGALGIYGVRASIKEGQK